MSVTATRATDLERAISDYLAVSRQAHLFDSADYADAEERAWARLTAALEAHDAELETGEGPEEGGDELCTASN